MYEIDTITWNQTNPFWWQKVVVTKTGNLVITYHYQGKSGDAGIVFEIDTKISHQVCGYTLIEKDIRDALSFLSEHHKIYKENSETKGILLKALIRAVVITYGKCFVRAEGRRIKLEADVIPEKYRDAHNELMEMRHQYVAHAGKSSHEYCKSVFILPSAKHFKPYKPAKVLHSGEFTELFQSITAVEFFDTYESLMKDVHQFVKSKLLTLKGALGLQFIPIENYYKFAKNKGIRVILNESDIEKLKNRKTGSSVIARHKKQIR